MLHLSCSSGGSSSETNEEDEPSDMLSVAVADRGLLACALILLTACSGFDSRFMRFCVDVLDMAGGPVTLPRSPFGQFDMEVSVDE